jgi:hypothetical protein
MDILSIAAEVSRQKKDLESLKLDPATDADSLRKCDYVLDGIATRSERLDVRPRFPQLHLLLAEIFARKNNYATAISETKTYLELASHAKDAGQVREQFGKIGEAERSSVKQRKNRSEVTFGVGSTQLKNYLH